MAPWCHYNVTITVMSEWLSAFASDNFHVSFLWVTFDNFFQDDVVLLLFFHLSSSGLLLGVGKVVALKNQYIS